MGIIIITDFGTFLFAENKRAAAVYLGIKFSDFVPILENGLEHNGNCFDYAIDYIDYPKYDQKRN